MYSPLRFDKRFGAVKPEGSLGLIYLAAALRDRNYHVELLDCAVGNDRYALNDTFYRSTELPNGMSRVGLSINDILKEVIPFDVIGLSSIFTAQTTMVEEVIRAISSTFPEKLIIAGGVNTRSQMKIFFDAGTHIICTSEAERTIVSIADTLSRGSRDFSNIKGIAFMNDGKIYTNCSAEVIQNLDELPIPAWDLQPLKKYWEIARPHGGGFSQAEPVAYAPNMTSRGCPFECFFCHIAEEGKNSLSGDLRKLRLKSLDRVMKEMFLLRDLGVKHFFIEDDSLLGRKKRTMEIFRNIIDLKVNLSGVNGINIKHMCTINGQPQVDHELLELMAAAGFKKVMLPVESGSQRIIDKYATGKLNLKEHDIVGLIRTIKSLGMDVGGNYTFGYPDETDEEVNQTYEIAQTHMNAGLDNANFMMITPFPGTSLHKLVVENDLLLPGVKIDELDWTQVAIRTIVPREKYEWMITTGWEIVNKPERVRRIRELTMVPTE